MPSDCNESYANPCLAFPRVRIDCKGAEFIRISYSTQTCWAKKRPFQHITSKQTFAYYFPGCLYGSGICYISLVFLTRNDQFDTRHYPLPSTYYIYAYCINEGYIDVLYIKKKQCNPYNANVNMLALLHTMTNNSLNIVHAWHSSRPNTYNCICIGCFISFSDYVYFITLNMLYHACPPYRDAIRDTHGNTLMARQKQKLISLA